MDLSYAYRPFRQRRKRMEKLLLKPAEVGEALSMSRSKVYELIAGGQIPSVKVDGCVRVPVVDFRAWVAAQGPAVGGDRSTESL
jgi:excisionase family DNA binding protein